MMLDFDMTVTATGPLFDGRAERAVNDFMIAAERDVARVGMEDVRRELHTVLKHPTGHYESQLHVASTEQHAIIADPVIYGPWLEGTSSRNVTTRFKGYFTFRRITQQLQRKSVAIANSTLQRFIARMR